MSNGGVNISMLAALALLAGGLGGARASDADLPVTPLDLSPPLAMADVGGAPLDNPLDLPPSLAPAPLPEPAASAVAAPATASPEAAPAVVVDPLPPALQTALAAFVADAPKVSPVGAGDWTAARKAIAAVYAERAYAPFWLDGDHWSARARAALARLARADEDGLDLAHAATPGADGREPAPEARARADIALSAAVVAYAMQASGARIRPAALSKDVSAKPEVADPAAALKTVAAAADPDAALLAFNPPQAGYRALRAAFAESRAAAGAEPERLTGPTLKLGMSDPRVPLIRARFGLGPLADAASADVYDVRVVSAVAAFQRVHGLPANGALTDATASALDGFGAGERREKLILANMEMWRWEPRDMGGLRVEVNVPDFALKLMDGDRVVWRTRVIVGKPDTATPVFSNSIKYMLFNPIWRVPESIVKKELQPHEDRDPSYLARHGYKVTYVGDKMMVEQPPGEANALGRMLFLFPNEHAVYLHDTPARGLFTASYRALSHGCVRVEDPTRLAEYLMGGAPRGWTDSHVRSLLGDKERTLSLPSPVPIHIEYFTEFADDGGRVEERQDIYGLTSRVASTLAQLERD